MTRRIRHGSIWLANLNPKRGTESGKIRPVLILQNPALLDAAHPSTVIAPLTINLIDDSEPLRIRINAQDKLEQDSDVLIDQVRSIDNKRLVSGPLAQCAPELLKRVYEAILEVMGISSAYRLH